MEQRRSGRALQSCIVRKFGHPTEFSHVRSVMLLLWLRVLSGDSLVFVVSVSALGREGSTEEIL